MRKSAKSAPLGSTKVATANQDHISAPPDRRDHHGFRGLPPPLENFSIANLSDDTLLTTYEVGALLRVSTNTLEAWRRVSGHPLKWGAIANDRIRYTVGNLKAFLAGDGGKRKRRGPPEPERAPRRTRRAKAEGLPAPQEPAP
jgi:hypothetical protein